VFNRTIMLLHSHYKIPWKLIFNDSHFELKLSCYYIGLIQLRRSLQCASRAHWPSI